MNTQPADSVAIGPLGRILRAFEPPSLSAGRPWMLEKLLAGTALLLVIATFRLWTPQIAFPQIPLLGVGRTVPPWAEWLGSLALASSLLMVISASRADLRRRVGLIAVALSIAWLVVIDGQRLQVWAYQFFWMSLMLATLPATKAWRLLRWMLISLYVFSAISKLDATFFTSMGPYLLSGVFGAAVDDWPRWLQHTLSALLPACELLVGLGLCFRATRGWSVAAACAMHGLLLVVLGPLGVDHGWGVLIWNMFAIGHVLLLFGLRQDETSSNKDVRSVEAGRWANAWQLALTVPIWLPLLEPIGLCDTWPAWAVYAPRNERTEVYFHPDDYQRLPAGIQRFVRSTDHPQQLQLRLDHWSLSALAVPVYPQNRLQLGMALAVSERFEFEHPIRVVQQSTAGRVSGERYEVELEGEQVHTAANRYWLNALPRDNLYGFVR